MLSVRPFSTRLLLRAAKAFAAVCVFGLGFLLAMQRQAGVEEIHLADSSRNIPLAIPRPFSDDRLDHSPRLLSPLEFSTSGQPSWDAPLPGAACGGACAWGDRVVVPLVDNSSQTISLRAVDCRDGRALWTTTLHAGLKLPAVLRQSAATPVCDGQTFYLGVAVNGRLLLSAVDLEGRPRWVRDTGPLAGDDGRLCSPLLHESLVILAGDHAGTTWQFSNQTSHLTAVHRLTGEIIWRVRRPNCDHPATPALAQIAGRPQVIVPATGATSAYDPASGELLWSCRTASSRTVSSVAWNEQAVFVASGEPQRLVAAIRADGAGDVTNTHLLWQSSAAPASTIPPVAVRDFVLCLGNDGMLTCLDSDTGKPQWRRQLSGRFDMSPAAAGDQLICLNLDGTASLLDLANRGNLVTEVALAAGVRTAPAVTRELVILRSKSGLVSYPCEDRDPPLVNTPDAKRNRL